MSNEILWKKLGRYSSSMLMTRTWQEEFAERYYFIEQYLDKTDEIAGCYPNPEIGSDAFRIHYHEDCDEYVKIDDYKSKSYPIDVKEIIKYKIDQKRFLNQITTALGIPFKFEEIDSSTWLIGLFNSPGNKTSLPVYVSFNFSDHENEYMFKNLFFRCPDGFILLTPDLEWRNDEIINIQGLKESIHVITLEEQFNIKDNQIVFDQTYPSIFVDTKSEIQNFLNINKGICEIKFDGGESMSFKSSKGFQYLRYLVQNQSKTVSSQDLDRQINHPDKVIPLSSSAEILDPEAISACKNKLRELDDRIESLSNFPDGEDYRVLVAQRNELFESFNTLINKNGDSRNDLNRADQTRKNISKAINFALTRIRDNDFNLYKHFMDGITFGSFFQYQPANDPVWTVC